MTLIKSPTKVSLEGKGVLTLRQADYVTHGGEGAIYRKKNTGIKLYTDAKKMKQDNMIGKIKLLATAFSNQSIIAPQGAVKNSRGSPVGFYMPFVSGEPLARVFTNDFRNREGFGDADAKVLAERMHDVVMHAHDTHALMVDANELNWIASLSRKDGPMPYVIDVDSWAIGSWPAKVIMPSIRDWHSARLSELTDWFAWGVVTFQLFTGIHPFKGKLDGYKNGEMERRMKDHASVFLPDVRLNRAVRDFSCIPGPLLDWYRETFGSDTRTIPPLPSQTGAPRGGPLRVMRTVVTKTGGLGYEKLFEIAGDSVTSVWPCGVVRTASGALYLIDTKQRIGTSHATKLAVTEHDDGWVVAEGENDTWSFRFIKRNDLSVHDLQVPLGVTNVLRYENRLFAATKTELVELKLMAFSKPILSPQNRWSTMDNATKWFKGVGISDVLGSTFIVAPFETNSVAFVKTPELDGQTVVDARIGTRYVEVAAINKSGTYHAYGFAFDRAWQHYSATTRDIDQPSLNTALLPKGVAARIEDDGELVVFVPSQGEQKVVRDKDIATTMHLTNIGDTVVYRKDGALWSLRMR